MYIFFFFFNNMINQSKLYLSVYNIFYNILCLWLVDQFSGGASNVAVHPDQPIKIVLECV